jgi:hypothetical protein
VLTGCDLGIADATTIVYVQEVGERLHVVNAEKFEALSLREILARVQRHGYVYRDHLAPYGTTPRGSHAARPRRGSGSGSRRCRGSACTRESMRCAGSSRDWRSTAVRALGSGTRHCTRGPATTRTRSEPSRWGTASRAR